MEYVNLHQHGCFSFLDGHAQYPELLNRARELGMSSLSITEHGNIHGWLDFYDAAKYIGVKPILGLEAYQARKTRFDRDEEERAGKAADDLEQRGPFHLTLLARNEQGYRNIIKLSSLAYLEGFYVKPRLDHELLARHSEGVTILSGCLNSELQQALLRGDDAGALMAAERLQTIAGKDHFFIEIQDHGLPEQQDVKQRLLEIAARLDAPVVPTGDCHYVHKVDAPKHDLMLCAGTGATLDQENRFRFYNDEFYLKSYHEMAQRFPAEWLHNTLFVAEQVDLELHFGELYFPDYPDIPDGHTVTSYLEELVWAGIRRRYGTPIPPEVDERTRHELRVVQRMGFENYFLVVGDLVRWAQDNDIRVGWGRGSAAGSILSYALGITNLDPLRFGLLFERFLVEGRKTMPDIDLDFDDRYRDRVLDYARRRYGSDRVAHICTFSHIGARLAVRDTARVLGYDYQTGNNICKAMPPPVLGVSKSIDECLELPEFQKVYQASTENRTIVDAAQGLEGLIRQPGIHAAGLVIAKAPTSEFVPIMRKGDDKPTITQWDMDRMEQCGLLKIDFLGLRNLGIVDETLRTMPEPFDLDTLPIDDTPTYEMLCRGETTGVFQIESPGMTTMATQLQPRSLEDIMALIALYRPGPMGSGQDKLFLARRHGRAAIPDDPVAATLPDTYGIMLYQEDVLLVARRLAGFSPGEADDLRKAIGKKLMDKIGMFREKFVAGCASASGIDAASANKIYSDIEYFGGYGFGKAHAASYAMLSYVTAYLKCHTPNYYMAALISSVRDKRDKLTLYLNEARRIGMTVHPPSINRSRRDFHVESDTDILFGLQSVKGVGDAIAMHLDEPRDYTSLADFMRRCPAEFLNKATLESLLNAGALDELVPSPRHRVLDRYAKLEILERENDTVGTYLTDHPLLGAWRTLEPQVTCSVVGLPELAHGTHVTVGGIVREFEQVMTRRGDLMYKFQLEDLTGDVEIVVFPRVARKFQNACDNGDIVLVTGRLNIEGGDDYQRASLVYMSCEKPTIETVATGDPVTITFTRVPDEPTMTRIFAIVEDHPGDHPVFLRVPEGPHVYTFRVKKPTHPSAFALLHEVADAYV